MSVFAAPAFDAHEAVHFVRDADSGLSAIIAVHSTALGPAAGGCRMWNYADESAAIEDVLRLSRGMSYKNAMADLPLGGGKAVIIGDARKDKTPAMFAAYGRAVEQLGGQYITAEDVGICVDDIQVVAEQTRYVSGLPQAGGGAAGGDPSPKTARGVYFGILAAVQAQMNRTDLAGVCVAVQGLGNVGMNLCRDLHAAGAVLQVADIHADAVERACAEFGATPVAVDEILYADVDVLAPCALGGILNTQSIPKLRARIVAGGANNQLRSDADGVALAARKILYAPDYVINAGGIINVAAEYLGDMTDAEVDQRVERIGERLQNIFEQARRSSRPTHEIADGMAQARLGRSR